MAAAASLHAEAPRRPSGVSWRAAAAASPRAEAPRWPSGASWRAAAAASPRAEVPGRDLPCALGRADFDGFVRGANAGTEHLAFKARQNERLDGRVSNFWR